MTARGEQPGDVAPRRWRPPRRARVPFAIALVVLVVLVLAWSQRRPIAEGFIDDELARRGIRARYDLADIGLSRQRLTNVVIGDPAAPDLVADRIDVTTRVGWNGAAVTGIAAGRVRVRGRVAGGRLSLGALDRLLPPPSGKPFALPDLFVAVDDARMRLVTPQGLVGVRLSGRGQLNDGFRGRLALASDRLAAGGCAGDVRGALALAIDRGAPSVRGPVRAARVDCGANGRASAAAVELTLTLAAGLDRWKGRGAVTIARAGVPGAGIAALAGTIDFAGDATRTQGSADLRAGGFASPVVQGRGLALAGQWRVAGEDLRFAGRARADRATLAAERVAGVAALALRARGTPVSALAGKLADAVTQAGRAAAVDATFAVTQRGRQGALVVQSLDVAAVSGARVSLRGGQGVRLGWPAMRFGIDGTLALGGGGLPEGQVRIAQASPGDAVSGEARFAPYAAGGERLALAPVAFRRAADGATRITTRATFSGGFPGGRVEGLALPVDARWDGGARLSVNPGCTDAGFEALRLSALLVAPARLRLCPLGDALVATGPGGVRGGASIADVRLRGSIGGTPLTLAAERAGFAIAGGRFDAGGVAVRLGNAQRLSRLDIAAIEGRVVAGGAEGRFDGATGAIGNVPLDLSGASGRWRFTGGRLTLDGETLRVADAAEVPRYQPLAADDFVLTLAGNRIDATGTLRTPAAGVKVADVVIRHDLGAGTGGADLGVTGITFGEALQPDVLTRLTFGVIADVAGTATGEGRIRWTPQGVTSDGVFRTNDTDLAAAFGPVEGIAGEIRLDDLLGLRSAGVQVARIGVANPGIPVEDGEVRYRLLGPQQVAVEGGRWPFAGGALVLEPTTLDFGTDVERRMVFRVEGVDAARFLQEFDFENLNTTGVFDGELPMVFDQRGGRIENGRLAVRKGGGTIAYVGEITREDVGTWGNLAFQALRSLRYERLSLVLNGPLSGEMVTEIRFAGVSQGKGAKSNFVIDRLAKLPLVFNITIRAPFRQLLDSVQSYYDPKRLIERNLPALLERQQRAAPVQPPASEIVP